MQNVKEDYVQRKGRHSYLNSDLKVYLWKFRSRMFAFQFFPPSIMKFGMKELDALRILCLTLEKLLINLMLKLQPAYFPLQIENLKHREFYSNNFFDQRDSVCEIVSK
jgi:hypothetical protein